MSHGPRTIPGHVRSSPRAALEPPCRIGRSVGVHPRLGACSGEATPKQFYFSWLVAFLYFLSLAPRRAVLRAGALRDQGRAGASSCAAWPRTRDGPRCRCSRCCSCRSLLGHARPVPLEHADAVAHDVLLQGKAAVPQRRLLPGIRAISTWPAGRCSLVVLRQSLVQAGQHGTRSTTRRPADDPAVSGPAFALRTDLTFAAFDWIMSLDPHWYSTIFGVYYFAGSLVGVFAFMILARRA